MKVVITPSVFGFGLSIKSVDRLIEMGLKFEIPTWYDEKYPDRNTLEAKREFAHWSSKQIDRTDKRLIDVVEELGDDAGEDISGRPIRLVVMSIPDNIEWYISTGDEFKNEWIAERHRTWVPEGETWCIGDE